MAGQRIGAPFSSINSTAGGVTPAVRPGQFVFGSGLFASLTARGNRERRTLPKQITREHRPRFPTSQSRPTRRALMLGGLGLLMGGTLPSLTAFGALPRLSAIDPFIADVQRRTFRFFWETSNPENGLTRDRYPSPSLASIAAVGFALTAYPIGVERGYVTRAAARRVACSRPCGSFATPRKDLRPAGWPATRGSSTTSST